MNENILYVKILDRLVLDSKDPKYSEEILTLLEDEISQQYLELLCRYAEMDYDSLVHKLKLNLIHTSLVNMNQKL